MDHLIPDLNGANLAGLELSGINFEGARLRNVIFNSAKLRGATFAGARLMGSSFVLANLAGANFSYAGLDYVSFFEANLGSANFLKSELGYTSFTNTDLRETSNLETCLHLAPSTIGIDTLYRSQGQVPDEFLRDAGVPDEIIDIARSIRCGPAIQCESCFISYSTKDDEFARRLHARMREANMRVWFAPEDLKGGKKLHEQLYEAIQLNDRLLLVLSEHSILSEWVMTEIRKARAQEKKEKRRKLFPIRLMDFATLGEWTCFDADSGKDLAVEVREYFIPDFSNWKDHDVFEAEFAKLQKALQDESARQK